VPSPPHDPPTQDPPAQDPPAPEAQADDPSGDEGSPDIHPTVYVDADDAADVAGLAGAERAVARGGGTAEQRDGVERAGTVRRAEDRLERWRARSRRS
jgi:hypothetical protein